jgi:hypothetical protein
MRRFPHFLILAIVPALAAPPARAGCFAPGGYDSQPPAAYACCQNLVFFNVTSWTFEDLGGGTIRVTPGDGSLPPMNGTLNCTDQSFSATGSIPGSCTETFTIIGHFTSAGHWTATFSVAFSGSACSCFNGQFGTLCQNQQWSISGTSRALSVPVDSVGTRLTLSANPFGRSIAIRLELERSASVRAEILDLQGRVVAVLCDRSLPAGSQRLDWNRGGARSGLYFLRVQAGGATRIAKLIALD